MTPPLLATTTRSPTVRATILVLKAALLGIVVPILTEWTILTIARPTLANVDVQVFGTYLHVVADYASIALAALVGYWLLARRLTWVRAGVLGLLYLPFILWLLFYAGFVYVGVFWGRWL